MRRLLRLAVVAMGVAIVGLDQWRRGYDYGFTIGRAHQVGESIVADMGRQLRQSASFTPQYGKRQDRCNNCGESITRHDGNFRCPHA